MPRTTPRRGRTPVTLASTTAAVAARIEPPNRASPPMTCPSSIRTSPTISATGTAATSANASSARAITSFDDMFGLRVAYQSAIVPTLPRIPYLNSRYVAFLFRANDRLALFRSADRLGEQGGGRD